MSNDVQLGSLPCEVNPSLCLRVRLVRQSVSGLEAFVRVNLEKWARNANSPNLHLENLLKQKTIWWMTQITYCEHLSLEFFSRFWLISKKYGTSRRAYMP